MVVEMVKPMLEKEVEVVVVVEKWRDSVKRICMDIWIDVDGGDGDGNGMELGMG